jgi:hypothetical protein
MESQLSDSEISAIRLLRDTERLSFRKLGERLGVDRMTAHRILVPPPDRDDPGFHEFTLRDIRKALRRLRPVLRRYERQHEEAAPARRRAS